MGDKLKFNFQPGVGVVLESFKSDYFGKMMYANNLTYSIKLGLNYAF